MNENFYISLATEVRVKNRMKDTDTSLEGWDEDFSEDIRELVEGAGYDISSAVEVELDGDTLTLFFLTDRYKLVGHSTFRGFPLPEGSILKVGERFAWEAKTEFDCHIFEAGDDVKISVVVFNDSQNSVDYYLRAFEVDGQPLEITLSEDSLIDLDAVKEGGYYDDKIITSSKDGEDIPESLEDEALDTLFLGH